MTKTKTIGISFPPELLDRAKSAAGPRNLSKFVCEAVAKKLSPKKKK